MGVRWPARILTLLAVTSLPAPGRANNVIVKLGDGYAASANNTQVWDGVDAEIDLTGLWGSIDPVRDTDPVLVNSAWDGRLHLLWAKWDGTDREIVHASRIPGGAWSGPVAVAPDNPWEDGALTAAVDPAGHLHVAWTCVTGTGGVVYHSVRIGSRWSPPLRLSGEADAFAPLLWVDGNGAVLVTFRTETELITVEVVVYASAGVSDDIDPTQVSAQEVGRRVVPR